MASVAKPLVHDAGKVGDKPADPYKVHNTENELPLKEKMEALLHFVDRCKYGMMTTRDSKTGLLASRCMELAAKESNGTDLLFFTNTHTHKVEELARDPHINISFVNSAGEWASVAGTATVVTDRALVAKHYTPTLKAWLGDLGDGKHDGSEKDPRLGMIRVRMGTASCSLSSKGWLGRAADVVQGAVTGSVAQVNSMREITEGEVNLWRSTDVLA